MKTQKSALIFIVGLVVLLLAFVALANPPAWAPAHGLRNKTYQYVYRYYPAAKVYFEPTRNLYFYEVNGKWAQTTTLSADLQRALKDFVTVAMDTQTPYEIHQEITAVYASSHPGTVSRTKQIVQVPREPPPAQQPEGQRTTYQYRYYPDADVYFDATRNLYFYQSDTQWFQAPTLPPDIDQRLTEFVQITLQTENPVEFNQDVVQIYPPFQSAAGGHQYLYYPDVNVYFDPDRELYFYYANDQWVKAPTLPNTGQRRLTEFVTLNLKTETPYEFQDAVSVLYPPTQAVRVIEHNQQVQPRRPVQQNQDVTYVYYYDQSVYFDPARALYFYRMGGKWRQARTLPGSITINLEQFANVTLNTLTPYVYHQRILKQYPPEQAKKIGKPEKVKENKPQKDQKDQVKENKPQKGQKDQAKENKPQKGQKDHVKEKKPKKGKKH